MPWVNSRQNIVDVEYGDLMGIDSSGSQYIYITDKMIGDGLVWENGQIILNGSILSKIDLLKLLIEDLKLDFNLSSSEILLLINEFSANTQLSIDDLKLDLNLSADEILSLINETSSNTQLSIGDLKSDLNLSAADILLLINKASSNTQLLNQIYSLVEPKDPIIIYKEVRTIVKEYIEVRTTKYVEVKCGKPIPPDKVERIPTGSVNPMIIGGWVEIGNGWSLKEKRGRKYYKKSGKVISEEEYKVQTGQSNYKRPIHHNWHFPKFS
jgi:hypothetical protein